MRCGLGAGPSSFTVPLTEPAEAVSTAGAGVEDVAAGAEAPSSSFSVFPQLTIVIASTAADAIIRLIRALMSSVLPLLNSSNLGARGSGQVKVGLLVAAATTTASSRGSAAQQRTLFFGCQLKHIAYQKIGVIPRVSVKARGKRTGKDPAVAFAAEQS